MNGLDCWLQNNEQQMIEDISGLVCIRSVSDASGWKECSRAMERMASYARRDGMEVSRQREYCISVMTGNGAKEIGIWNHLDVVPAADDWLYEPFSLHVRNGYLIGRGVQDNKGPAIAVYYALRFCKEKALLPNIRVRQILGTREETGMADVKYYVSRYRVPDYSFVADCGFPVCCGEKGICRVELETDREVVHFLRLEGGTACNSVPERAYAELLLQGRKTTLHAEGISGHAAFPEHTLNAIGVLADRLSELELTEKESRAVSFIRKAAGDGYGEGLEIACEDECSGRLTCNAGVMSLREGHVNIVLDIRYPVTIKSSQFMARLQKRAQVSGFVVKTVHDDPPYYKEKDDPFVKILMDAWKTETGRYDEPFVMGGGTYVRHIPNAVAFGPGMERDYAAAGLPEGHGNCHCADEAESVDNLKKAVRIYVRALVALDRWIGAGMKEGNENS